MKKEQKINVCTWVGECGCRLPAMIGKSYCEQHYARIYDVFFHEMADYIIEKELKNGQK